MPQTRSKMAIDKSSVVNSIGQTAQNANTSRKRKAQTPNEKICKIVQQPTHDISDSIITANETTLSTIVPDKVAVLPDHDNTSSVQLTLYQTAQPLLSSACNITCNVAAMDRNAVEQKPDSAMYKNAPPTNVQSSVPGLSIAEIRAILSDQRKIYQEKGYVHWTDAVINNLNRMEFNFEYVKGIARKRFAKHQRASNRAKENSEEDEE